MSNQAESRLPLTENTDVAATSPAAELDRGALNALTSKALEPGVYFGRGLDLRDEDRTQLKLVAASAEAIIEPGYQDPAWNEFQKLVDEGDRKGVLISFTSHEGTKVPSWCVDGGEEAAVKKIRTDSGRVAIQVPSRVFNQYHWTATIRSIKKYAGYSDELLRGQSTKVLGENLYQLSHLISAKPQEDQSLEYAAAQYGPSDFFEQHSGLQQWNAGAAVLHAARQEELTPGPGVPEPEPASQEASSAAQEQPSMVEMRRFARNKAKELREENPGLSLAEANDRAIAATRKHFGVPEPEFTSTKRSVAEQPPHVEAYSEHALAYLNPPPESASEAQPNSVDRQAEARKAIAAVYALRIALGDNDPYRPIGPVHSHQVIINGKVVVDDKGNIIGDQPVEEDDDRRAPPQRHAFDPSTGTSVSVDRGGRVRNAGDTTLRTRY